MKSGAGDWLSRKDIDFLNLIWVRVSFRIVGLISCNIPERSRFRKGELFLILLWKDLELRRPVTCLLKM